MRAEVLLVDLVHGAELAHVQQEDRGFHHMFEAGPRGAQHAAEVLQHAAGLHRDVSLDHLVGGRIEGDLTRAVDHPVRDNSLRIGADLMRRVRCGNTGLVFLSYHRNPSL